MTTIHRAALSLGANLGDPARTIETVLEDLVRDPDLRMIAISPFFETEPVDMRDQAWFVNAAAVLSTTRSARALLAKLTRLEEAYGRVRTLWRGPRSLDIDLLLFDEEVVDDPDLTVPHPRMAERRFVLEPLVQIAPDWIHPAKRLSVAELHARCPDPSAVRLCPGSAARWFKSDQ